MRISRLIINNFRVFPGKYEFDFSDKQLILVGGPNGHGKSSLFDSIQWCLTGEIRRYRGTSEYLNFNYLINENVLNSQNGRINASVEVWLETDSIIHKITRTVQKSRTAQTTKVRVNGENYGVKEGNLKICGILFRGGNDELQANIEKTKLLASYFSTTQLLSQDQLHEFILTSNPQERFTLMEKVLGLDKYGSDFGKYLMESIQVIKEEKGRISTERQEIRDSWLEVSTQLNEKETLQHKLGETTEKEIVEELAVLHNNIKQFGVKTPDKMVPLSSKLNEDILLMYSTLRRNVTTRLDEFDRILLTLQNAKSLFGLTEGQFNREQQELKDKILALDTKKIRRKKGVLLGSKNRTELDVMIQKNRDYVAKQREIQELNEKVKQVEDKIIAIERNPNVLIAKDRFGDIKIFIEEYNKLKKDYLEIEIKSDLFVRERNLLELGRQMDEKNLQKEKLQTLQDQTLKSLNAIRIELSELTGKINSGKENTIAQMIHDIQHSLLDQLEDSCPVCGTKFISSDNLHTAVRLKWEEASQKLTVLEQDVMKLTGQKNELDRKLKQIELDTKLIDEQIAAMKNMQDEHQIKIEQQKALVVNWNEEDSEAEIDRLKNALKIELDNYLTAFNLVNNLDEDRTDLLSRINERAIATNWCVEQEKVVGRRAHYLNSEELLVNKIKKVDQYLLQAKSEYEQIINQLKDQTDQLMALEQKWNEQAFKTQEIKIMIPDFNQSDPKIEVWIGKFNQQKAVLGSFDTKTKQVLEKAEAFLSKGDITKIKKEELTLREGVKAKDEENKHFETLEIDVENLRTRHNEIRSTIMTDYLINYSEIIDQLFMQISPHAIYKHVHLIPRDGKLYVLMSEISSKDASWAELSEDELAKKFNASLTFSSAQANVLAICIFLSLALSQQWTPLEMIGIDDPFQNMDDINVFSFIDVISQVVTQKQVLISSHNEDFVSLIKNKSGLESEKIGYVHFQSYSRDNIDLETNCKVVNIEE
ncbi:AAA family ATPase [Paenibacillus taichungensis]